MAIIFGVIFLETHQHDVKPNSLGPLKVLTPEISDTISHGRYKFPARFLSLKNESFFGLKRWSFVSLSTENYLINIGIVTLNYVGKAFFYVIEKSSNNKIIDFTETEIWPLPSLHSFANSSIDGCTVWKSSLFLQKIFRKSSGNDKLEISFCGNPEQNLVDINMEYILGDESLSINGKIFYSEGLAMLYPLSPTQTAYTHKEAGMKAIGSVKINNFKEEFLSVASIDWTYSMAKRITVWKWCQFQASIANGSTIGINLSDEVYTDKHGTSQENLVWKNNKVLDVFLDLPVMWYKNPTTNHWYITSPTNMSVLNITFVPFGSTRDENNLFIFQTKFFQYYGKFQGILVGEKFENVYGVIEEHYAKW